ncbi:MAG: hypothetical protein Q6368_003025 [Candidatus Baldrarchaeota archaeon]
MVVIPETYNRIYYKENITVSAGEEVEVVTVKFSQAEKITVIIRTTYDAGASVGMNLRGTYFIGTDYVNTDDLFNFTQTVVAGGTQQDMIRIDVPPTGNVTIYLLNDDSVDATVSVWVFVEKKSGGIEDATFDEPPTVT